MKKIASLSVFVLLVKLLTAQADVVKNERLFLPTFIDMRDQNQIDFDPALYVSQQAPVPANSIGNKKSLLLEKRKTTVAKKSGKTYTAPSPVVRSGFAANVLNGTPADNTVAISNDNKIVSMVNTNFRVYNASGTQLIYRSLSSLASALGPLGRISDPRAIYDPVNDRFIVLFFNGVSSDDTRIIVGFSRTNDPAGGGWNFYQLPGNYLNDSTWSDYPIVSITDNDLFFTFNHLKDNLGWQDGFRYSAIWQVDKQAGYTGNPLQFNFFHNIVHQGKAIWSVCPVQGGDFPTGNVAYFLSVRPGDLENDTVFLHSITGSYHDPSVQFNTQVLKTDVPYGLSPNANQKDGQYLATNDARVLSAMYQNNQIHFVSNCIDPLTLKASIYSGTIKNVNTNPVVSGEILSYDSAELGYPSICYIGTNAHENRALINCNYITASGSASVGVIYKDNNGNHSPLVNVFSGTGNINLLSDTVERWGDYSGIQRKYNEPHTAWLAASVANGSSYRTYIASVVNQDSTVLNAIEKQEISPAVNLFPNPAAERIEIDFDNPVKQQLYFDIYAPDGKKVAHIMQAYAKQGGLHFSFSIHDLSKGTYLLRIANNSNTLATKQFVKD